MNDRIEPMLIASEEKAYAADDPEGPLVPVMLHNGMPATMSLDDYPLILTVSSDNSARLSMADALDPKEVAGFFRAMAQDLELRPIFSDLAEGGSE